MQIIKLDEAPGCVLKLALAFMEMVGPAEMLHESPVHLLHFGAQAGVNANALIAAMRWLGARHAAQVGKGSVLDNQGAEQFAEAFEAYAALLEELATKGATE